MIFVGTFCIYPRFELKFKYILFLDCFVSFDSSPLFTHLFRAERRFRSVFLLTLGYLFYSTFIFIVLGLSAHFVSLP